MKQDRVHAILAAVADAVLPPANAAAEDFLPGAAEVAIAGRIVALVGHLPPLHQRLLRAALWLLEYLPWLQGQPRFSALDRSQRAAWLLALETFSPLTARALLPFKMLTMGAYLEAPQIAQLLDMANGQQVPLAAPLPPVKVLPVQRPEDLPQRFDAEFDVVIVGSGAGAAPLARTLARAGWSVALVEEGDVHTREEYAAPPLDRMPLLYRDAGATVTLGKPVVLLPVGRAVGGTTVVNSGTCLRTPDRVIAGWETAFASGMTPDALGRYYAEVERTLGVAPASWSVLGGNAATIRRGVEVLGLSGRPLPRNAPDCHGAGQCAVGCPNDAKRGVHLNYLPQAVDAGATIFARARVDAVVREGARAVGVRGRFRTSSGTLTGSFQLRARRGVVIAAGAIGTPGLLRASGVRTRAVGRHLRLHPATGVTGRFRHEVKAWRGVLQSYLIETLAEDGILLEATFPPPSLGYAEAGMTLSGLERKQLLGHFSQLATLGLLVSDTSEGRVLELGGARSPLLFYNLNDVDRRKVLRGMKFAAEILLAAGAVEVVPMMEGVGPLRSKAEVEACFARDWPASRLQLSAYHPMGTARIGAPGQGVVDGWGNVHGVDRLVVCDASVFPTSLTVNPQVTIMAFAHRAAERMLEAW